MKLDESRATTEGIASLNATQNPSEQDLIIRTPVSGIVVPIEHVPDPVFAQKIVGQGVAIDPLDGEIISPCAGHVSQLHPANHAIAIKGTNGVEVLIHVGLDTVKLKGEGFQPLVRQGQTVEIGTPLLRFELDLIARKAKSLLTEIVITSADKVETVDVEASGLVTPGTPLLRVRGKAVAAIAASVAAKSLHSKPIEIINPTGLHARPAAVLAGLAKRFQSVITLKKGDRSANIRSLVEVMGLEIENGDSVILIAQGADAQQALELITHEIKNGLGEKPAASTGSNTSAATATKSRTPVTGTLSAKTHQVETNPAETKQIQPRVSSDEKRIFGVTASPGLAIGEIFQLKRQIAKIEESGESPERESRRLSDALQDARLQLEALKSRLEAHADHSQASIFAAHQELLDDPGLLDLAREEINQGKSAAYAWRLAYETQASRLEALKNQLLAARANDLKDVGQRVISILTGDVHGPLDTPKNCILIAEDLTPSDIASIDRSRVLGFCTTAGGSTSHVAILARSLDLPALAGVDPKVLALANQTRVILDATHGELRLHPSEAEIQEIETRIKVHDDQKAREEAAALEPAITRDGTRIEIVANLKASPEATSAVQLGAEGVGLLRTEFLFMDRTTAPSEDEQYESYLKIVQALGPERLLIIRTLDVGGDKPLSYLPLPKEDNPFLGERGIRVSLARPDVFRTQVRAILRTAKHGKVRIMFPMITTVAELREAKAIVEAERAQLGIPYVPVGIMVEVPAAALLADHFAREADFFSIGSNDLTQYALAIDRGHPKLAAKVDGLDPSVLRLIAQTVKAAHAQRKWVGVCGGIAGDPQAVPLLIGMGVDELSVSIPSLPTVKAQVRRLSLAECKDLADRALQMRSSAEVRSLVPLVD